MSLKTTGFWVQVVFKGLMGAHDHCFMVSHLACGWVWLYIQAVPSGIQKHLTYASKAYRTVSRQTPNSYLLWTQHPIIGSLQHNVIRCYAHVLFPCHTQGLKLILWNSSLGNRYNKAHICTAKCTGQQPKSILNQRGQSGLLKMWSWRIFSLIALYCKWKDLHILKWSFCLRILCKSCPWHTS